MRRTVVAPAAAVSGLAARALAATRRAALALTVSGLVMPALTMLAGCGGARVDAEAAGQPSDHWVTSNVLRRDYAGSAACETCHDDVFRSWAKSPMHNMTRAAEQAKARAPFGTAATTFHFKEDTAELYERDGQRFVRLTSPTDGAHLYRVTRVIGGHHREDFAGVEVASDASHAPTLGRAGDELILPLSYVYATESFRLKGYSVMVGERPGLRAGGVWNQTCILCHNTAPYFLSLFDELLGPGARAYQGEVVDRLLPRERRWGLAVRDPKALGLALTAEMTALGGDPAARGTPPRGAHASPVTDAALREQIAGAIEATRMTLNAGSLVELGIGCESCHGGSSEHAANPKRRTSFVPRAPFLAVTTPPMAREPPRGAGASIGSAASMGGAAAGMDGPATRAAAINHACARCHQVLFSRYPFTWEGGERRAHPGGSHISSGEARDMLLGGCSNALACTACHDPHGTDSADHLRELGTIAGNRVCVGCHARYATRAGLAAHSHHQPDGTGAVCINCHMPLKNMGLDYALVRYHRIGSPNDPDKVEKDRPIECALCHTEATVGKLVGAMQTWWGKRYDPVAIASLYGADPSVSVLSATLDRGKPHEKAVAVSVLGTAGAAGTIGTVGAGGTPGTAGTLGTSGTPGTAHQAVSQIARELLDPYPLVRYYAADALARIAGDTRGARAIDLDGAASDIAKSADVWLGGHGFAPAFGATIPSNERKSTRPLVIDPDED